MGSEYKTSFMLDRDQMEKFVIFCHENLKEIETESKYQIARFCSEDKILVVYRSGIVIFQSHPDIEKTILTFIDRHNLQIEEMEQYESFTEEKSASTGWDETPRGVYLTEEQVGALVHRLAGEKVLEGEKHESMRIVKGDQLLVFNTNRVVHTIGGFEGILELLREVIESESPYGDFQRVLIFDEKGRWDKIGPLGLAVVDIFVPDLIELQIAGIKDQRLSRGVDHVSNMGLIEPRCTYHTLVLEPEQINEAGSKDEYHDFLKVKIGNFIDNLILQSNPHTLIICDESLYEFVKDLEGSVFKVKRKERDNPSLGVSSTITGALVQKWAEDWYKYLGYLPDKQNIEKIRNEEQVKRLAKMFLL
ncbi:MAG: hypothetical protein ACXAE3_07500 [Candidatus Kariarchaeaceae archaeon]|jgi:ribonuclease HIII